MNRTRMRPSPTTSLPPAGRTNSRRPRSLEAARRPVLPRWGDQHPDHRMPTFLETLFFEGDTSATSTGRYDL